MFTFRPRGAENKNSSDFNLWFFVGSPWRSTVELPLSSCGFWGLRLGLVVKGKPKGIHRLGGTPFSEKQPSPKALCPGCSEPPSHSQDRWMYIYIYTYIHTYIYIYAQHIKGRQIFDPARDVGAISRHAKATRTWGSNCLNVHSSAQYTRINSHAHRRLILLNVLYTCLLGG